MYNNQNLDLLIIRNNKQMSNTNTNTNHDHQSEYQPIFPSLDRFIQPFLNNQSDLRMQTSQKKQTSYEQYLKKQLHEIQRNKNKSNNKNINKYKNKYNNILHNINIPHNININTNLNLINKQNSHNNNTNKSHPTHNKNIHPQHSFKTIKIPNIVDDFYLNVLDWSCNNILAIGLKRSLYYWLSYSQHANILYKQNRQTQITSVKFCKVNNKLAIGNSNGIIKIYDLGKQKQCKIYSIDQNQDLQRINHLKRVSSLDWYNTHLISGSRDGYIIKYDDRTQNIINTYKAHKQQISGLKYNNDSRLIASGGNDNKLLIYQNRMNKQLVKFNQHKAAIKALDWCKQNSNIIAAGGGTNDKHIRFFNTKTLTYQYSIYTGSQICNLLFSKISNQLLTTHGYNLNQINIWNTYTLWEKQADVYHSKIMLDHTTRVLYMAENYTGDTIVTAAADRTIRFWHPFQERQFGGKKLEILQLR